MRVIKAILMGLIYIVSAFIAAMIITVSFFFIKPFFEFPPSTQILQLSEVVVRSQEVVASYWQKYQQCPTSQALLVLDRLALVESVEVTSRIDNNEKQCKLIIVLDKHYFNNKKIRLLFSFNRTQELPVEFLCYINTSIQHVPQICRNLRDIDSFNVEN